MGTVELRQTIPGIRFCGKRSVLVQFAVTDRSSKDITTEPPAHVFALLEKEIQGWLTECRKRVAEHNGSSPETAE